MLGGMTTVIHFGSATKNKRSQMQYKGAETKKLNKYLSFLNSINSLGMSKESPVDRHNGVSGFDINWNKSPPNHNLHVLNKTSSKMLYTSHVVLH